MYLFLYLLVTHHQNPWAGYNSKVYKILPGNSVLIFIDLQVSPLSKLCCPCGLEDCSPALWAGGVLLSFFCWTSSWTKEGSNSHTKNFCCRRKKKVFPAKCQVLLSVGTEQVLGEKKVM
uniref:Uncharacterized protein n=1 Tax=Sphaerodactylus townsendi TaxID=933632 RepID=A0ACB8F8V2_9SAUR